MKRLMIVAVVFAPIYANAGSVKLCRQAGITSLTDGKPITIPAGSQVRDVGTDGSMSGDIDTHLAISKDATIVAKSRCVTVPVTRSGTSNRHIGPHDGHIYRPEFSINGAEIDSDLIGAF